MQQIGNKIPTIKERMLYVLEIKGIVKDKFCNKIGMTYGNFTGKAKETPLNSNAIGNILLELPDLNPDWLILGTGSVFREGKIEEVHVPTIETPVQLDDNSYMKLVMDRNESLVVENYVLKQEVEQLKQSRGKVADTIPYTDNLPKIGTHLAAEPRHK